MCVFALLTELCVCVYPLMSSTDPRDACGQRLTAVHPPLSVIVWWRPDSDGGLLVLELQPRIGSIFFARDGVYNFFLVFILFIFYIRHSPLTMYHGVLWAFQGSRCVCVCVCVCVPPYELLVVHGGWAFNGLSYSAIVSYRVVETRF